MKISHILLLLLLLGTVLYLYETRNMLGLVIVTGALDGLHPCGLTVLLFFIAFLLSAKKSRRWILLMGAVYILGVFLAYFGIGLGILKAVSIFAPHFMARLGAVLLFAVGAISIKDGLTGTNSLAIPEFTKPYLAHHLEQATLIATFIAGILVGLCAFPCVGGLYVAIITMLSAQGLGLGTFGLLVVYNLMFVLPLVLVLLFSADERLLSRLEEEEKRHHRRLKLAMGAMMALFALYIMFGGAM